MSKDIEFRDSRLTLFCMFRYALGRKSYILSSVTDDILNNWDKLEKWDKNQLKKEISEHEDRFGFVEYEKHYWNKITNKIIKL